MSGIIDRFVEEANTWVGVRYKDKGRDRGGVDCAGIMIKAAQAVGLTTYDTTNYSRRPDPREFLREMKGHLDRILKSEIGHGDVCVFAEPSHPCHVGIVDVDAGGIVHVIHAWAPAKKVIREVLTGHRRERMLMAFRFPVD